MNDRGDNQPETKRHATKHKHQKRSHEQHSEQHFHGPSNESSVPKQVSIGSEGAAISQASCRGLHELSDTDS